jgi:hypothetical protein
LREGVFFFNAVGCQETVTERDYHAHEWVFCLPRKRGQEVMWGLVSLWPEKTSFEFALPTADLGLDPSAHYRLHDLVTDADFNEYGRVVWSGADLERMVLSPEPFRPYFLQLVPEV